MSVNLETLIAASEVTIFASIPVVPIESPAPSDEKVPLPCAAVCMDTIHPHTINNTVIFFISFSNWQQKYNSLR